MTRNEALSWGTDTLVAADLEEAGLDAWYLLSETAGISRAVYYMEPEETLPEEKAALYRERIEKRAKHIPLQYILGTQEFMGLPFLVSEAVLIPRQDTEILVEEALAAVRNMQRGEICAGQAQRLLSVLDVCTGSGCIIISIAKMGGNLSAKAVDISPEALAVAQKNAEQNGVLVTFLQGDLFEPVTGTFDLIVSNPPYIMSREIEDLMPEVRVHEPRLALDGGADGLIFYRRIAKEAGNYLNPGGQLMLEIGCEQAAEVSALLAENGYQNIRVEKDLAGLDRVVCAVRR